MKADLQTMLQEQRRPIGTFLNQGNAAAVECIALSGMDYLIIDSEHGPYSVSEMADLLRAADVHALSALIRIPDPTRNSVLRALDIGAKGLVIPNVRTMEEVRQIVAFGKYPPVGQRGFAAVRAAKYGADPTVGFTDLQQRANRDTLLLPQCETEESLHILDEILSTEGIGGVFVGPYDLSAALGCLGDFEAPVFKEAIDHILDRCRAHGKYSFLFSMRPEPVPLHFEKGFDSVTVGLDYDILLNAYRNAVDIARS